MTLSAIRMSEESGKCENIFTALSYYREAEGEGRKRNQGHQTTFPEAGCQSRREAVWRPILTANQRHLKINAVRH